MLIKKTIRIENTMSQLHFKITPNCTNREHICTVVWMVFHKYHSIPFSKKNSDQPSHTVVCAGQTGWLEDCYVSPTYGLQKSRTGATGPAGLWKAAEWQSMYSAGLLRNWLSGWHERYICCHRYISPSFETSYPYRDHPSFQMTSDFRPQANE